MTDSSLVAIRTHKARLPAVVPVDSVPIAPLFSRRARAAIRAIAEALFTTDAPLPPERLDWLVDEVDDFVSRGGSRTRLVLRLSLVVVSWVAPLFVLALPPLRHRSLATRRRALERIEPTLLGLPFLAVKAVLCLVWFEHPDVLAALAIDAQCLQHDEAP